MRGNGFSAQAWQGHWVQWQCCTFLSQKTALTFRGLSTGWEVLMLTFSMESPGWPPLFVPGGLITLPYPKLTRPLTVKYTKHNSTVHRQHRDLSLAFLKCENRKKPKNFCTEPLGKKDQLSFVCNYYIFLVWESSSGIQNNPAHLKSFPKCSINSITLIVTSKYRNHNFRKEMSASTMPEPEGFLECESSCVDPKHCVPLILPLLPSTPGLRLEHLGLGPAGPASTGMELDHFRISCSWTIPARTEQSCAEAAPGAVLSHWSQQSSPIWRLSWSCFFALAHSTCSHTFGPQNAPFFFFKVEFSK